LSAGARPPRYDVIVAGLGAMGSATAYHLALRGRRVLGLDRFAPGHANGSSHGDSRIIRESYFEHPLYVPVVQRAAELWRELERRARASLLRITGGLMLGPEDGEVVTGTLRSAAEHALPHERLAAAELHRRFPAFRAADDVVAVWDPRAGILDPEACTLAHLGVARQAGAELRFDEPATAWAADGEGVRVTTPAGSYRAGQLVLAAGSWNAELLPDLALPLEVERQVLFWLDPDESAASYDPERFPIYAYEFRRGQICYGFPRLDRGAKAAVMHGGETADHPDRVRRTVRADEVEPLRAALRPVLPSLAAAPVLDSAVCLFTNTPDRHFVIDVHPAHPQVLVSSPCSGHGFKFASAIGELQADLLTEGRTRFDLSPFGIGRFGG
jgi:sarcosine oxidase